MKLINRRSTVVFIIIRQKTREKNKPIIQDHKFAITLLIFIVISNKTRESVKRIVLKSLGMQSLEPTYKRKASAKCISRAKTGIGLN